MVGDDEKKRILTKGVLHEHLNDAIVSPLPEHDLLLPHHEHFAHCTHLIEVVVSAKFEVPQICLGVL